MAESRQSITAAQDPEGQRAELHAKALPLRLPLAGSPPALVPARMINEVLYCERLLYLEWAQGEFADNYFTVDGRAVHRRADEPRGALPPPPPPEANKPPADTPSPKPEHEATEPADDSDADADTHPPYEARSLWLSSDKLGITAKIDVVEGDASGGVTPIEYKRGAAPDLPDGAYLPERAQLCAQVLLLREDGYRCDRGAIYFAKSKRRVEIEIDEGLIRTTLAAVARAREIAARGAPPDPLVDSPKCHGCSLSGICLPDEVTLLQRLAGNEPIEAPAEPSALGVSDLEGPIAGDPWDLMGGTSASVEVRRLQPARDDKLPLYVQEQGARISLQGDRLMVHGRESGAVHAKLPETSHVALYGNVQMSTQALRELLVRGIPVSFFSSGGWYYGRASGVESKNADLRAAQHRAAAEPQRCLAIARGFVVSKIKNCRTMLRRNCPTIESVKLGELDQLARKAQQAEALDSLLGYEGTAARVYFSAFSGMLKQDAAHSGSFDLEGRNRRPPKDPINALLSFTYSLLTRELANAVTAAGLDPLIGFYHQPRFGRPALALDLMEEFRPIVADSTVIGALNTGVFADDDFVIRSSGVAMAAAARKKLIHAYERRMDQLVTHPVFGYRISYRRVLEVQARLLGRWLLGEIAEYPPFRTR